MNVWAERLLQEVWERVTEIYAREKRRIDEMSDWSPLHDGIMSYLKIARVPQKPGRPPLELAIDVYEPFSWSDDAYKFELRSYLEELSDDLLRDEFWPALQKKLTDLRRSGEMGPHFFRYRFELIFEFRRPGESASLRLSASTVEEPDRARLQASLDTFIRAKVESESPARPKPRDDFFFARLLTNPDFLPEGRHAPDAERLESISAALNAKFKAQPERSADWNREFARALNEWAEERFLPIYFDPTGDYARAFELKPEADLPPVEAEALAFFLYVALRIGPSDPERRSAYLKYAADLGSDAAKRYLTGGSGTFESERRGSLFRGRANDVLQSIELKLLAEEEQAYREALEYLRDLLRAGFPKAYALKLGSKEKHFLPLKKLAKSPLHRFFAGALRYPALFPLIAEYAELAMEEFAWYGDVPPGEKSVMPGTYAALGLGLASAAHDDVLLRYMRLVDTEHQSAHDEYPSAFLEARGLDEQTLPLFVAILLGGGQSARPLKHNPIDTPESAQSLKTRMDALHDYERELVIYRLFGGEDKLLRAAKRAEPAMRQALEALK